MVLVGTKTWVALGGQAKRFDAGLGASRQGRVGGPNERETSLNRRELNFSLCLYNKNNE